MDEVIFKKGWFSHCALMGVNNALHGREDAALNQEKILVQQLILYFLDCKKNKYDCRYSDDLSFFSFCYNNLEKSHSQILQDLWVLYMSNEKRSGFFVEFGACDGMLLSNTRLLEEEYGWEGVLSEPNPVWINDLRKNRSAVISDKCVHERSGEYIDFISTNKMPELSRISSVIPDDVHEKNGNRLDFTKFLVETTSLLDLLRGCNAPKNIDYLSIDTEGSEYDILRNFDFEEYSFDFITVEHAGEEKKREDVYRVLTSNGYCRWSKGLTRWDDWYYRKK